MPNDRRIATVIGGGPGGLMVAEVLASGGLAVTVHEHRPSVGRKLLLAGRGGLNISHSEPIDSFATRYGAAAGRLRPALQAFGPADLRAWCAGLGEPTFVGSSGRVFPSSFRATPLLRAWLARLQSIGVQFALGSRWLGWRDGDDGRLDQHTSVFSSRGSAPVDVASDVTVLALGGASWPRVGSDGGWVDLVRASGVVVRDLRPANCGVWLPWSATFADRFAGVPLKNVAITVADVVVRGDTTITANGMEGGPVYAHSSTIRETIDRDGRCLMTVDLHPDLAAAVLAERLAARRQKDSTSTVLRRTIGLTPVAIALLRETTTARQVPIDPFELASLVKAVPMVVTSVAGIDRAISSAGGIALDEVDDSFMLHRLPGTFVAGEMLDWDAPTGGYLLQATWSTAVAAANGALAWLGAEALAAPSD